jgi:CRP-like cAMP-binding protein
MSALTKTGGFLGLLAETDRARLVAALSVRAVDAGAAVISADDPPGEMYVVLEGEARVSVYSEDGRDVSYRDLTAGDVFGELAMLDGAPRSAYVTARSVLKVGALPRSAYDRLAAEAPGIALAMNLHLTAQIRSLTTRVLELSTLVVRARLMRELARRASPVEGDADRAILTDVPTHADLASRIGTHREAITKELSRMVKAGLVERDGDRLIIPSLSALSG